MASFFYLRLAAKNLRRSKNVYLPFFFATAIISGVYFLISGLMCSDTLTNLPSGETAQTTFKMGIVVFTVFAFFFMLYINAFLARRRKREFGLYAVLGMSKRDVGRVLVWENLMIIGVGVIAGMVFALILGRLLFMLLTALIHAAPGSEFSLSPIAFILTGALFFIVLVVTCVFNCAKVRMSNPIELLHTEKRGEKDSKLVLPMSLLGLLALGAAYYYAAVIEDPFMAIGVFFLLVLLVIAATYMLFTSGSIVLLRLLRRKKSFYYKPQNFVTVSGMFHRMRQNAAGLATICILSTMLTVTVSGTLSLYLGQEDMLQKDHPQDVVAYLGSDSLEDAALIDDAISELAEKHGVVPNRDGISLISRRDAEQTMDPDNIDLSGIVLYHTQGSVLEHSMYADQTLRFNLTGSDENCNAFVQELRQLKITEGNTTVAYVTGTSDVYDARLQIYGVCGGMLFLGAFFGVLFLAVTVLIIYFKQITEGYEDRERFVILQQVGMDASLVKSTINRQMLIVFTLPLMGVLLHMLFAGKMMTVMLRSFGVTDTTMVALCTLVVCALFTAIYAVVYKLTSRAYYKIVKW